MRLKTIYDGLSGAMAEHGPGVVAVEDVFQGKNARSALILGHARGVALVAAANYGAQVFSYSPAAVKKSLAAHGRADKRQLGRMVSFLLCLDEIPAEDAGDALGVAICHGMRAKSAALLGGRP